MDRILPIARQLSRAKWLPPLVIVLTLAILGGMICLGARQLRDTIGRQIIQRDAEVLDEVATLEQLGAATAEALAQQLEEASGQMTLALRLSRLRDGVLATRIFDAQGRFVAAMPVVVKETALTPSETEAMATLHPLSRYESAARLDDHFLVAPQPKAEGRTEVPLLSVLIPIHAPGQTNLMAVTELILDGQPIARELAVLERNLTRQAVLAFVISGGIVTFALGWSFRRLQKITAQLQAHAAELRRANQELALAAKTSALGAVTAHLLHGLTSPLSGLQNFVAAHAADNAEWKDALRGTERMQSLVGEMVRILSEQTNGASYELPLAELSQVICGRIQPAAEAAGVKLEARASADGALSNRNANLTLLILENLLQNAVQATPRGKAVRLEIRRASEGVICEVADEGPGLPASVGEDLFMPCRSTKPGGNGIGLTLSHHLARQMGGELKLLRSDASGCVFALVLPSAAGASHLD